MARAENCPPAPAFTHAAKESVWSSDGGLNSRPITGGNGGGLTRRRGMVEAESRRDCFARKPPLKIQTMSGTEAYTNPT